MRRSTLPAASFFLALTLALTLALPALAVEPFLSLPDAATAPMQQVQQPQAAPSTLPPMESKAIPLQAKAPIHMDQALAREHERFTQFAIEQMHKMNANVIGGKHSMQVQKHGPKLYRASYKAIDVEGIVCQVRRSSSNPNYYVGSVLYKEHILESVAEAPEACRHGQFIRVSEKANRIIYSSKHGGGWQ
ncbi:MAG: hypothetical protein KKF77_01445 [Proteobacteria bacterium]|nr:hypothetical protein [Pseudomonadota bacterium]